MVDPYVFPCALSAFVGATNRALINSLTLWPLEPITPDALQPIPGGTDSSGVSERIVRKT